MHAMLALAFLVGCPEDDTDANDTDTADTDVTDACSDPVAPPVQQAVAVLSGELTSFSGCGDVVFYAMDADSLLLVVHVNNALADAEAVCPTGPVTTVYELPDGAITVGLDQGTFLHGPCTGEQPPDEPVVEQHYDAIGGTATLTIWPAESGGMADLDLANVVLHPATGDDVTVANVGWVGIGVGFYPP